MTVQQPRLRTRRITITLVGASALVALFVLGISPDLQAVGAAGKTKLAQKRGEKDIRKQTPVQVFMQAKLKDNSKILEGLMTNQFAQIASAADHLSLMSTATQWHVIQGPVYKQHSEEFRRSVAELKKAANKKNLDGASLAYMHMTMTCINCHKFVRGTQLADGNAIPTIDEAALALRNPK